MKKPPTVIASAKRHVAIELVRFEIGQENFDDGTLDLYYTIVRAPGEPHARIAVAFDEDDVRDIRPESFGMTAVRTKSDALAMLAEASIGRQLDEFGAPPPTPGGQSPYKISGQVAPYTRSREAYRERRAATDDEMAEYLDAHVFAAWQYGGPPWSIGPSDLARLKQSPEQVMRIVRLYDGERWSIGENAAGEVTLIGVPAHLRRLRDEQASARSLPSAADGPARSASSPLATNVPRAFAYVADPRVRAILVSDDDELQRAFAAECWKSTIILSGSSIEAILMDRLKRVEQRALAAKAAANKGKDIERWDLSTCIDAAVELDIVEPDVQKFAHSVREYRNLVHAGNALRSGLRANADVAAIAKKVYEMVDRDIGGAATGGD